MSDREAVLMERIEVLEDEVRILRAANKDIDKGMEKLRDLGMQTDRDLMETSAFFAFLLVSRHGGEASFPMHAVENWMDKRDSRVVVALEKDMSTGTYKARAITREEGQRIAGAGPRPT